MVERKPEPDGFIVAIVRKFLTSHLAIIFIITSLCLGIAAILATPREEEPQIVVPVADVYVHAPGANSQEIEKLVTTPLERLLWQIDGVEYVYSMSRRNMAIVTVRFFVGEDREKSLIKLRNKISMNQDRVPAIVKNWVVKPVEIDDVPIVTLALYSARYHDHELRRIGEEILARLSEVRNISRTDITGGRKREIRVELLPERMAGFGVSFSEVQRMLQEADSSITAGSFSRFNKEITVTADSFLTSIEDVSSLVAGVNENGSPVHLRDIANIIDGPQEPESYSRIGFSSSFKKSSKTPKEQESFPAVTLSLAKKKGTNAVTVSEEILAKLDELKKNVIPSDVKIEITRNYGKTAQQKVNELLSSLGFAILTVVVLLAITLGWREALVVALAVPISFSLALFVNFIFGYTINRVTLFALILSLGLVVDDPITNVDNIQRHILKGKRNSINATLFAVSEVLPPVIMSTLAIIICFTPLFFITGMMGPYMAPMASNVPITVIFSTLCAITVVPWFTHILIGKKAGEGKIRNNQKKGEESVGFIEKIYRMAVNPFLESRFKRYLLLVIVLILLVIPAFLMLFRLVPLKMLPFDNKNEFLITVDMAEGTTLETTDMVVREFEDFLREIPEVTNYVSYVGIASPIDFNGLVRHYYLRKGSNLADIRVNLLDKDDRKDQSHSITLRLRKKLENIAKIHGADIKIIEVPPGPPVLSTVTAELYGEPDLPYDTLIKASGQIKKLMSEEPFVVDIDDLAEAERDRVDFVVDREKAALHGVSSGQIIRSLKIALHGTTPATMHLPEERQPLSIRTVLPRSKRSGVLSLSQIPIKTARGNMVPLAELVKITHVKEDQPVYHKNLERVVYVIAEMAGRPPAEAVIDMKRRLREKEQKLPSGVKVEWAGEGEWKITLRVFRDMGIAFAAAMLGIYILLIIETNSFFMPMLIMMAIPLTLIGAMPGFWLLNLIAGKTVGGFNDPVFFTATGMIGMIALGGIVIRNSLVLIEFIHDALKDGVSLKESILKSGAIRMRPILLTAGTTALGAWPITLDPIFSGLAWTLIFGLFASTLFTLIIIPVTYYALYRSKYP
ncbi:efflux RND transporter permease subunit [Desulfobacterales bacterium HSG16]|nr:efflux RND transporter permease subunit [Desulfobacterales bacterium HSG16]